MSKKIGLLLRNFAKTSTAADEVVRRAVKSITRAHDLRGKNGEPVFEAVIVLVPEEHDYGGTANAIIRALPADYIEQRAYVLEVSGHHSCEALNEGIEILANMEVDYAVILSNKAIRALTSNVLEAMLEAFAKGAKVVGVAVDELREFVLEGRIQNTFAGWDIKALQEVGGFDSETGVEEISPTVRLVREYGPCIAVLDPHEKPALDIRKTDDGHARHNEVMTTKLTRQQQEVERIGADFAFIRSGIMPGCPISA